MRHELCWVLSKLHEQVAQASSTIVAPVLFLQVVLMAIGGVLMQEWKNLSLIF